MREFIDFAAHKLPLSPCATREKRIEHSRQMLLRVLGHGTTVAVIGAGLSVPFGYPTWKGLGFEILDATLALLKQDSGDHKQVALLRKGAQAQKERLSQNALMFLVGTCKQILKQNGLEKKYYRLFHKRFAKGTEPGSPKNAFDPLLKLPIRRFVTTNYDYEIERALIRQRNLPPEDFGLGRNLRRPKPALRPYRRSFTQRPQSLHDVAYFALSGVPDNEDKVFHCHGRFDDPETIVVTEEDYQRWYLNKQEGASLAFQQSFELLLGSNPLLFIGYSLGDEDLLRPLRELVALDSARKGARPIFALLEKAEDSDPFHHDALYERYGLHVIPFSSLGADQKTEALSQALQKLKKDCDTAIESRSHKPLLRPPAPEAKPPEPHLEIHPDPVVRPARLPNAAFLLSPGITVLVGPSGAAKTDHAMDLLHLAVKGDDTVAPFDGAFYWNAHYANETVTGIDYALGYFDPEGHGPQCERVLNCLRYHRYLFVIDGCERLLRTGDRPGAGEAYSINFRRLLHTFADPSSRSTVLLVGRTWLADLDPSLEPVHEPSSRSFRPAAKRPTVRRIDVSRLTSDSLAVSPFSLSLSDRELTALFSLLEGHHYGLDLAGRYLKGAPRSSLIDLNRRLAMRQRDERLYEMLSLVLEKLDEGRITGLARAFLETLSLFLNPICETTLILCYSQALQEKERGTAVAKSREECSAAARQLCCEMVGKGLLLRVGPLVSAGCQIDGYTVYTTARRLLYHPSHGLDPEPLPAVGLSGFTAGRTGVPPDRERLPAIQSLFDLLLHEADQNTGDCSRLCRDAFGLIRTRMEANTAPRWVTYDKYLPFGIRIAKLAKRVSGGTWTFCEPRNAHLHTQGLKAPLYAAELAWLYNDSALALSAEGSIVDACGLWEQAYEVSRQLEDDPVGGGFRLEVLLSLTFTSIEMGRLLAARAYLEAADRILLYDKDDEAEARILGLRGLMAHLGGNLQAADDFYDRCLHLLRSGINLRAQSIFLKHKADIKITTMDLEQADLLIRRSRALAEAGVFPELIAQARMSEGHRLFRSGDPVKARLEYSSARKEAQRMGIRKLEVRVLTALARLALSQKDADSAHSYALHSLRLANEMGLGLRQTHSLVVLGLSTLAIDQRELGIAILRQAKRLADAQEYWARSREAENKLQELSVKPDGKEYPAQIEMLGRG